MTVGCLQDTMVEPPIDIVTVFLCYANYTGPILYFVEVGLPSSGVGLKFRAHGAADPVYAPLADLAVTS